MVGGSRKAVGRPALRAAGFGGGRAPRARVALRVAYEDAEGEVFVSTHDVSETGALLIFPDPPRPGGPARLLLELPGHPVLLRLPGTVVRSSETPRGFAVAFDPEALSTSTRAALRDFVARA